MNEAAMNALASFQHDQALSRRYAKSADAHLATFLSLVGRGDDRLAIPTGHRIKCVREFTRWLSENGPALKATIESETGVKFTERGTPHTVHWNDSMAASPDDAYLDHTIMRIDSLSTGAAGRPPVIYFLWSQRFDVRPRFGVGPERPAQSNTVTYSPADVAVTVGMHEALAESFDQNPPAAWGETDLPAQSNTDPEPKATVARYATLEEWDEAWASTFDALASAEAKATDAQKEMLRATLPEDADANAAIAIAYRQATQRVQQGLLGVVQPPPEDITTWESETDPRGWEQEPLPPAES